MTLIYLSCAWIAGIFLGSKVNLSLAFVFSGLIPLLLFFVFRQYKKAIILTSLCLIILFCGIFYFQSNLHPNDEKSLRFYNDSTVEIKGIINTDPEIRDNTTQIQLSATEIMLDTNWHSISGEALLFVPRYPIYEYGDVLSVSGKLETPPQLDDFDYKDYLAHQGIFSTMLYPEIELLERGQDFKLMEWVYSLRNQLSQTIAEVLPEPQASLAQGIILGKRGTIPASTKDNFARTGTTHILAISGLNLSILAGILLSIGIWLFGKRGYVYVWLALAIIWLYTLLTGMHPPVIRSSIMASLFLAAELLGRQRNTITSLTFAAAIMIGITPQILWDASFQLSFLAMAGLIFAAPPLMALGRRTVKTIIGEEGIAAHCATITTDSLSISLGATIAIWPVIAYYFGIVSLVSPLATLLLLPVLPVTIVSGALAGILGLFAPAIGWITGWLTWLFLSYILLIVNAFAALPISSIEVNAISPAIIWAYYAIITITLWLNANRKKWTKLIPETAAKLKAGISQSASLVSGLLGKWVIPPMLTVAVLASFTAATMPDDKLHVSFLDVGQGDAIIVQQGNRQILIDGGPSPQAICLGLSRHMPFWDRSIDMVVLTHPDADHITGLVEVLRRYKVGQALYPDCTSESPLYDEWLKLLKEKDIKSTIALAGQQINLGEGTIKILNPAVPPLSNTNSDADNNGVVIKLSMGIVSILLTADIRQETEFELISLRADLYSTILKVSHHGSNTSTSQEFIAAVAPRLAVISVGKDNKFGHPGDEMMSRLVEKIGSENIYRTDECGTIEFITNGTRLWVKTEK